MSSSLTSPKEQLALQFFELGVVQFGQFKLKSGMDSPFYLDFRRIVSYPNIQRSVSELLWDIVKDIDFKHLCGVPYAALSLSSTMGTIYNKPLIVKRKEVKKHGTKKMVEGIFSNGDTCLVLDDVISSGISMIETLESLEKEGLVIKNVLAIVDRMQGGSELLAKYGYNVYTLFTVEELLEIYHKNGKIDEQMYRNTLEFIQVNQINFEQVRQKYSQNTNVPYAVSKEKTQHPIAKKLLDIVIQKQSNLCVSADLKTKQEILALAQKVAPYICMLKVHADAILDFDLDFIKELKQLSIKQNFLLFEDRKLADIGSIAQQQFVGGVHKIADWADVLTVHVVAGASSIEALKATKKLDKTALIVVAEMSTEDTLTTTEYTEKALAIAEQYASVVLGVVAQNYRPKNEGILLLTPGINLEQTGDNLGQTYNAPDTAFTERGVDIMIVGRGIYMSENPAETAKLYREIGWNAKNQDVRLLDTRHTTF